MENIEVTIKTKEIIWNYIAFNTSLLLNLLLAMTFYEGKDNKYHMAWQTEVLPALA